MRTIGKGLGLATLLACGAAQGAQLAVDVADRQGRPVADAVVSLVRADGARSAPAARAPHVVDQKNLAFRPYVEVLRPGESVVFRNSDATRHHVYSFSRAKSFEYVVAPRQESAPMTLPRAGVVAVGCNIHDGMISYLYVTDAPWSARSDARGHVVLDGLPAGTYEVRVWHPRLPPTKQEIAQPGVVLGADDHRRLPFALALLPDPRRAVDRERTGY